MPGWCCVVFVNNSSSTKWLSGQTLFNSCSISSLDSIAAGIACCMSCHIIPYAGIIKILHNHKNTFVSAENFGCVLKPCAVVHLEPCAGLCVGAALPSLSAGVYPFALVLLQSAMRQNASRPLLRVAVRPRRATSVATFSCFCLLFQCACSRYPST